MVAASVAIAVLAILLLGFVPHQRFGVSPAFGPFLAICGILLWLIFCGGLNLLWLGRLLLYLIVFAVGLVLATKHRKAFWAYLTAPAVLAFLLGCLFLTVVYLWNDSFYFMWDDFSNWGPLYKNIFLTNRLHIHNTLSVAHPAYPEGTTVLYYFTALFSPLFREAQTYASLGILLCGCACTLLHKVEWKTPLLSILGILCVPLFFVLFPYSDSYISVYLDTALGAFFGATLLLVMHTPRRSWQYSLAVGLAAGSIAQVKEMGLLLALVCVALYAMQLLLVHPGKEPLGQALRQNFGKGWWLQSGLAALAMLLPTVFWKICLSVTGQRADQFSNPFAISFFDRIAAASRGEDPVAASIWEQFTINFFHRPVVYNGYGTPVVVTALLVLFGIIFGIWRIKLKKNQGPAFMLLFMPVFFAAYLFSLFYTYICMMTELEGLLNASYERYVSTFMIGWCMLALGVFLRYGGTLLKKHVKALPSAAMAVVLALILNTSLQKDVLNLRYTRLQAGRIGFDAVSAQVAGELQPDDDIWVIAQGTDGLYRYMYHYMLIPTRVNMLLPISLGQPGSSTEQVTPSQFIQMAKDNSIEYVLLYIVDDAFVEKYGSLFEDGLAYVQEHALPCLYRVQGNGEDKSLPLCVAAVYP